MWYGIGRLFIVRKYFKGINYKINKLIYKDIPDSKVKRMMIRYLSLLKKAYHFEKIEKR